MTFFTKKEPWIYLGHTELKWTDAPSDIIHFYGRGENFTERKIECNGYIYHRHCFYEKVITPWLKDAEANIWKPIASPSESLQVWTQKKYGYKHIDNRWVKPAPEVERKDNVISWPKVP